jgi:hypothetical protein
MLMATEKVMKKQRRSEKKALAKSGSLLPEAAFQIHCELLQITR